MAITLGPQSFIFSGYVPHHEWQGAHALSLKVYLAGEAVYEVEGGRQRVTPGEFLIINAGQPYTLQIQRARSACVFFAPGFAESVARSLTTRAADLLAEPAASGGPIHFYERVYAADALVLPIVQRMQAAIAAGQTARLWHEERLHELMGALLRVQAVAQREVDALPAQRPATRDEVYRRVHRARDFIRASATEDVALDAIARVACMSPNHLLRSFRQVFGETPHQCLTEWRIAQACQLLRATQQPVVEICAAVGYTSVTSFTARFRQLMGTSPDRYRRQLGDFREVQVGNQWHTAASGART
ncbi:MAG: helix-turn-helix transcriptional regulator [Ktedonobacterales bacterium]|nr:helix-turn-helix transcriptional regulator [Ktedonobacterales bacterium]